VSEATRQRVVETPEGVPLRFTLARGGDRATAFVLDYLVIMLGTVVLGLLTLWAIGNPADGFFLAFFLLVSFLLQVFYFPLFELRWRGQTPGKRVLGIRVVDAQGGPLTAQAIFARNLTRIAEIQLPMQVLLSPETMFPESPKWAGLLAGVWLFVLLFLPLFNRERLRVGDLVGGTRVVVAPKAVLLDDIGQQRDGAARYDFTHEQLQHYGSFELQVLEDLLRREHELDDEAFGAVCEKIKTRIGWSQERWKVEPRVFLRDFYTAQRARLEHDLLFGRRIADKQDARRAAARRDR
jgi:uncharacterized RDD family membrane protein YckC